MKNEFDSLSNQINNKKFVNTEEFKQAELKEYKNHLLLQVRSKI